MALSGKSHLLLSVMFDLQDPRGRELTPISCPLTVTYAPNLMHDPD